MGGDGERIEETVKENGKRNLNAFTFKRAFTWELISTFAFKSGTLC